VLKILKKFFPKENPQGAPSPKGRGQHLKGQDAPAKGSPGKSTEQKSGARKVAVLVPAIGEHGPPEEASKKDAGFVANNAAAAKVPTQMPITLLAEAPPPSTPDVRTSIIAAPQEYTYPQIQELLTYTGAVLTEPDGAVPISEQDRLYAVLLEDRRLLVGKGQHASPSVAQTRQLIRSSGYEVSGIYSVPLGVIRQVYDAARLRKEGNKAASETIPMQQAFLAIVQKASRMKASDIHLRVGRSEAELNFTIDGLLRHIDQLPAQRAHGICSSAFAMADASDPTYNLYEHQGARISIQKSAGLLPDGVQSLRLQFNALVNGGRELVVRILKESSGAGEGGDVDTLGYTRHHVVAIQKIRRKPFGVNIISGPTGSGKSTTLHRALTALIRENKNQKKLITIEDPPEYIYEQASQLPVTNAQSAEERKEKFTQAINAAMRSAPHIIMIGEIRDNASAALAMEAGMTGHQVWASLHANDAASILDRLKDKEVEEYKLLDHTLMTGLIGQRLIRRICPHCRIPIGDALKSGDLERYTLSQGLLDRLNYATRGNLLGIHVVNPDGCDKCEKGQAGREVVAEVIAPDQLFMTLYRSGDKDGAIEHWIEKLDGMTIQEHAITKMMRGACAPWDVEDKTGDLGDFRPDRFDRIMQMSGE
jgi:general secretion pathway protein E